MRVELVHWLYSLKETQTTLSQLCVIVRSNSALGLRSLRFEARPAVPLGKTASSRRVSLRGARCAAYH